MKKFLFLLMFMCMGFGFSAYVVGSVDPTLVDTTQPANRTSFKMCEIDGLVLYEQTYRGGPDERSHIFHLVLSNGKVRWVMNLPRRQVNGRYNITAQDLVYCNRSGSETYGPVCNESNAIVDPIINIPGQSVADNHQDADQQPDNQGNADNNTPRPWEIRKPFIIVGVSAAAAGSAYAITKFINKQWNKQYNAKKVAAFSGIGAGIMTGVYLYWSTVAVASK